MRNSICRVRERKIALCGLAYILEKIGGHDLESDVGKTHNTIRSPSAAVEIIRSAAAPSAASTKSIATCRGKSCPSRNPVVVTRNRTHDSLPQGLQHPVVPPGAELYPTIGPGMP